MPNVPLIAHERLARILQALPHTHQPSGADSRELDVPLEHPHALRAANLAPSRLEQAADPIHLFERCERRRFLRSERREEEA